MSGLLVRQLALVTGGGAGIGRAICEAFAKQGASVVVTDINKDKANETLGLLPKEGDSRHCAVHVDITSPEFVEQLMTYIKNEYQAPPSLLVNNAGIVMDRSLFKMSTEQWDWVLTTNLKGPFLLTQAVAKAMVDSNVKGSIINISSIIGKTGNFGQANYASAKAGLIGLTKTVARELGPKGIRCNAILPGYIQTDMTKKVPEAIVPAILAMTPLGRLGQPAEIADACVFLASDLSRFVTGASLEVTGGLSM